MNSFYHFEFFIYLLKVEIDQETFNRDLLLQRVKKCKKKLRRFPQSIFDVLL